jgi:hypothetical protein
MGLYQSGGRMERRQYVRGRARERRGGVTGGSSNQLPKGAIIFFSVRSR